MDSTITRPTARIFAFYRLFQMNTRVPFPSSSIESLWSCNIWYRETLKAVKRRISHTWRQSPCKICRRRQGDFTEETWSFSIDISHEAHALRHLKWESNCEKAQDFSLLSFCLWRGVLPFPLFSLLRREGCQPWYLLEVVFLFIASQYFKNRM